MQPILESDRLLSRQRKNPYAGFQVLPTGSMDLDEAGVYAWSFDNRYIYVGMARCLRKRLQLHMGFMYGEHQHIGVNVMYQRVARKHRKTAKFIVLENVGWDRESVLELEEFWIDFFETECEDNPKLKLLNMGRTREFARSLSKSNRKSWTPQKRREQAKRIKAQWKDPEFQAANQKRLARLTREGRMGGKTTQVRLSLPSGNTYWVGLKEIRTALRIGTQGGALQQLMESSPLLSGWKILEERQVMRPAPAIDTFSRDPSVKALLRLKRLHGDRVFGQRPCWFEVNGVKYKALSTNVLKAKRKECRSSRSWHEGREMEPIKVRYFSSYEAFKSFDAKYVRSLKDGGSNMKNKYDGD